jgi:serine/threonine protein kinase/sugar lactone lactonase YvrE
MIGTRLAHYEITALLGKGGMGEVYRATDTKLGRDVALKILPSIFASDPERMARFEREARTLAAVQHTNIASIYGFEQADGHRFLVMELAEGEELSDRIARGPIPVEEALQIALQIAEGLETAHENGIVHRDLKPANVIIGPDGQAKLLDFGLARAIEGDSGTALPENSPTLTAAFTAPGVILGTAAYMSPEQARGKAIDKRSDIWAFGVIMWEMLTGDRLFGGETVSDILAAVLTREADPATLPGEVPPSVRALIARCLEREPKNRLRDIGEARLLLSDPSASMSMMGPLDLPDEIDKVIVTRINPAAIAPWLLLAAVLALVFTGVLGSGGGSEPERRVRRFEIPVSMPEVYNSRAVEISPDGKRLAIFGLDGLWVRDLDNAQPRLLVEPGDLTYNEVGITPFWSPDNAYIAYGTKGRLWKIAPDGGKPQVICTLPGDWMGAAWGADDMIVICTSRGPMYQVPARGGDAELLLPIEDGVVLDFHQPSYVPVGGGFVYSVHRAEGVDTLELLRNGERKILLRIEGKVIDNVQVVNNPVYSPSGHIVYQRDQGNRGLWALPFDAEKGEVTGPPFLISSDMGHPSISQDGTLVHAVLREATLSQLVVASREGRVIEELTEDIQGVSSPVASPDGRYIAYSARESQNADIFLIDRESGIKNRLTMSDENDVQPCWIPGTDRLAYVSPSGDCNAVWALNADGTGQPELIIEKAAYPTVGPDGKELVFTTRCAKERGLMRFRIGDDAEPKLLREHPAGIDNAWFSPNGRNLAYSTWESGEVSIEVIDYPDVDSRHLVARTESVLRWSADGSRCYYISQGDVFMTEVELEPGPGFRIKARRELFDVAALGGSSYSDFNVSADGQEFYLVRQQKGVKDFNMFTVVENWYEEFRD